MKRGTEKRKSIRPMTMGESSSSGEGKRTCAEEKKGETHEGTVTTHIEIKEKDREHKVHIREAPKKPTKREVEEHEVLHERYEPWCGHCVRGKGRNRPHRSSKRNREDEDERVPRISMDYNFAGEDHEKVGRWLTMVD